MTNKYSNTFYPPIEETEADYRACERGWDCAWLYVQTIVFLIAFLGGIYIIYQLGMIISGQVDAALSI